MAGALPIVAKQCADAEPPGDPAATPREIGECPGVMTMDTLCRDITPWAAGCGLGGSDQEGDLGARVAEVPGVQLQRGGFG